MALDPLLVALDKSLDSFTTRPLRDAGRGFFSALEYSSALTVDLRDAYEFLATFDPGEKLDRDTALCDEWLDAQFLYQITDDDVLRVTSKQSAPFHSSGQFHEAVIESYLILAIHLKPRSAENGRAADYTRTQLADATRAINRLFPMPALVLFRHGQTGNRLSLAIIRRRLNRRDNTRDVLEAQVSLFKDIPLDEAHRPQLEILKAFSLSRLVADFHCHNFVGLHAAWEERLGSYRLDERFYTDIAQWFFWAVKHKDFVPPRDVQNSNPDRDHEQRSIFLIRLLTRLIFCWFLRQKGLIPHGLFRENSLKDLLKDTSPTPTDAEGRLVVGPMIGTFEKLVEAMVYELFFEPELHAARLHFFKLMGASEMPPPEGKSVGDRRERLTAYFNRISALNHPLREALFSLPALEIARLIEPASA